MGMVALSVQMPPMMGKHPPAVAASERGRKGASMHDILEPILHKASVSEFRITIRTAGLSIGDTAELHLCEDGTVAVYATILKRGLLFRRRKLAQVGLLGQRATALITPALRNRDHLRVRIVGLTPEHLSGDGRPEMNISVWGAASAVGVTPHQRKKASKPAIA